MSNSTLHTKDKRSAGLIDRLWMGAVLMTMIAVNILQGVTMKQPASNALAASARDKRVVMYVMDHVNFALSDAQANMVDQVNYSFALIKDGEASGAHWQGIRAMSAWLKRNPEVNGVLSVGGWGADGFSQACASEEGRIKLADSMIDLMNQYGFVGLDIDWEYPGSSAAGIASSKEDVQNWHALLSLLRAQLDEQTQATGRKHLLSVAVGAGENELAYLDGGKLNSLVDQVMLMSYDLADFGKTTAHHAGLYPDGGKGNSVSGAVEALMNSGLDHDKLLMGIPAYGRVWRQVSGEGNGLAQKAATSGNKTLTYAQVLQLEDEGYTLYYDDEAQAAWYYDGTNFVSAEDERSLRAKAAYVLEHDLAGVGVWCWNHDPNDRLVQTLLDGLTL